MIFSHNDSEDSREEIKLLWDIGVFQQYEKYLVLPPIIERSRKKAFSEIKTKVWKKLQLWKDKLLSQDGREVLIKVAILPTPTYAMSCFKFSKSLYSEIESLMARF